MTQPDHFTFLGESLELLFSLFEPSEGKTECRRVTKALLATGNPETLGSHPPTLLSGLHNQVLLLLPRGS